MDTSNNCLRFWLYGNKYYTIFALWLYKISDSRAIWIDSIAELFFFVPFISYVVCTIDQSTNLCSLSGLSRTDKVFHLELLHFRLLLLWSSIRLRTISDKVTFLTTTSASSGRSVIRFRAFSYTMPFFLASVTFHRSSSLTSSATTSSPSITSALLPIVRAFELHVAFLAAVVTWTKWQAHLWREF